MRLLIALCTLIGMLFCSSLHGSETEADHYIDALSVVISSIDIVPETCGIDNGSIYVNIEGDTTGVTYSIDGGNTFKSNPLFENLGNDDYLILARDAFGTCTAFKSRQIVESFPLDFIIEGACVSGENSISLNTKVDYGFSPYEYQWEGPGGTTYTSEVLTSVEPGRYSLTLTDALGCMAISSLEVIDCCVLEATCAITPILINCSNDIPDVDPQWLDPNASSALLSSGLLSIGMDVASSTPCGNLSLEFLETDNITADCTQDYTVLREYRISDDINTVSCIQEITVSNYASAVTTDEAESREVSCSTDVDLAFSTWLAERAGMALSGCSAPYTLTTLPDIPFLDSACDASTEVTFVVEDACGRQLISTAIFSVVDDVTPSLVCPLPLAIDPLDPQMVTQLDTWIESAAATDNCAPSLSITNDLNPSMISLDCDDPAQIEVAFRVEDDCNNDINCKTTINILSPTAPVLSCGQDLEISCDDDRAILSDRWIQEFKAEDATGAAISISNDLSLVILEGLSCNESMPVSFTILDDCGREIDCLRILSIIDMEAPRIICPGDLVMETSQGSGTDIVNEWIKDAIASDNCVSLLDISDDLTRDFSDLCVIDDVTPVQFSVEDGCGNNDSCIAEISVKQTLPSLVCPSALTVECGEDFGPEIQLWLGNAMATDNNGNNVVNDFSSIEMNGTCRNSKDISFTTIDNCGEEVNCQTQITIEDTRAPIIQCPEVVSIELQLENNKEDVIRNWLRSVSADDCTDISFSNDLDPNILDVYCSESHTVEFRAKDLCDNSSSCTTEIHFLNESDITISCPDEVFFRCTDPYLGSLIDNHLELVNVISNIPYATEHNYSTDISELDCEYSQIIEIETVVTDYCEYSASCYSYIELVPDPKVYIPNVFTPDAYTDNFFTAYGNESVLYIANMIIYNRWGDMIFVEENLDINKEYEGWNGQYQGKNEEPGVFTYLIEVVDRFGNKISNAGTVQVLGK